MKRKCILSNSDIDCWAVVVFEAVTDMMSKALMALGMVGLVAIVHATGLVVVLRAVAIADTPLHPVPRFGSVLWLFIWVPFMLIVIHLLEIGVWGCFFWWRDCFPDFDSSLYFAGASYTTLGYGDLVLSAEWRLFGPLAAFTGVLSPGLSVSFFVAVVGAVYQPAIVRDREARASRCRTRIRGDYVDKLCHTQTQRDS